MNFSQALEKLKLGCKIQREGWIAKGMYLTLVQGYSVNGHLNQVSCSDDKEIPDLSVPELNPDGSKNITQGKAPLISRECDNTIYDGDGIFRE